MIHRGRGRKPVRAAAAVATTGVVLGFMMTMGAGPTAPPGGGEQSPSGEANIWIENGGGACAGGRSATPIAYADAASPDRICGTFDAAWDAMNAGDTARVVASTTYASQQITGDKASDTFIIGTGVDTTHIGNGSADIACDGVDTVLCAQADHMWLEDMSTDSGGDRGNGNNGNIRADNVTLVDVNMLGDVASLAIAFPGFTWRRGTMGDMTTPVEPICVGGVNQGGFLPLQFYNAGDGLLDGITFKASDIGETGPSCDPHMEDVRLEGPDASNITIMNSQFSVDSDVGSGHIFCGGLGGAANITLINNVFPPVIGTYWIQTSGNCDGANWHMYYNTFTQPGDGPSGTDQVWVGNLGYPQGCSGTHTKNVWSGSGSCGTDTYTGVDLADMGFDQETGVLSAGSEAIDAAETPDSSDACTDAAIVNSVDLAGTVRPQGSVCDAGADEYTG